MRPYKPVMRQIFDVNYGTAFKNPIIKIDTYRPLMARTFSRGRYAERRNRRVLYPSSEREGT